MDNQHRKIKGYKELSQEEINLMNEVKELGPKLDEMVNKLFQCEGVDHRWTNIGKTHLQQGLMALTRSIARPDFF